MRQMTPAQQALVREPYRKLNYDVRVTTKAQRQVSLRHYRGREFLKRLRISGDIDSPTVELELEVQREWESISFSPFMTGSVANRKPIGGESDVALELDNVVEVYVGVPGEDVLTENFMCIFRGRIVSVDPGTPLMKVVARDVIHDLSAVWVEEAEQVLGSEAGTPCEDIIRFLLQTYGSVTSIITPVSPNWLIRPYNQQCMSVWEAVSVFADQIGWDIRYRWTPGDPYDGDPTFFNPDREKVTADYSFSSGDYYDLTAMPYTLDNVRNIIYVSYGPPGDRKTVWRANTISQERYRLKRAMWIEEASDSPLQTDPEASLMAKNILSDLAFPKATMTASLPLFPWAELHDVYSFAPNGVHFDTAMNFSVSGFSHEIQGGEASTSLTLRDGAPAAGSKKWLRREHRQGVKYL